MATAAPTPQSNPPDPQVIGQRTTVRETFDRRIFGERDPAGFAEFLKYQSESQRALTDKYTAEEKARLPPGALIDGDTIQAIRDVAAQQAEDAARQKFAPQIIAAGAGTSEVTTTPLLATQPVPPVTSSNTAPVTPAANSQVPAATPVPPPGRSLLPVTDDGSGFNRQIGDVRADGAVLTQFLSNGTPVFVIRPAATPTAVAPAVNPQVPAAAAPAATPVPQVPGSYPGTFQNPAQLTPPGVALEAPEPVNPVINPQARPVTYDSFGNPVPVGSLAARSADVSAAQAQAAADLQQAGVLNAQLQAQQQVQRKQANDGDWRIKLRLAPAADYLYKASNPGILQPLAATDGVIFPYTPKISTTYQAVYNPYDLTHSNYRGYFYQGSHVGEIKMTAIFTAQDTSEANYLLAVIQFFRSVTKMFYGQDQKYRGSPPPLVYLQGLGEFQFNLHPCVVSQFDYTLPDDVDYIRARSVAVDGTNLLQRRAGVSTPGNEYSNSSGRLGSTGLTPGAVSIPPAPPTLGVDKPTYVPTKMEVAITLLPMQSRAQVSQEFSLTKFANGDLVKGGYW